MRPRLALLLSSLVLVTLGSGPLATAGVITFYGFDPAAGPGGAHPNSDAARAAFVAALAPGTVGVENFEGDPLVGGVIRMAFPPTGVTGTSTPSATLYASVSNTVDINFSRSRARTSTGLGHLRARPSSTFCSRHP